MKLLNCISLMLYISVALGQNSNSYKFCVHKYDTSECSFLQKGNSQASCVPVTDSVDCALKLRNNEADFAVFTAEEALLVSKFINDDIWVIGELRSREFINENYAFQTVVLVHKSFTGGLRELQGKNYCHPGFGDGQFWSDSVLKEFEKAVVRNPCSPDNSSVEQEVNSLASFFKSACRPGQWAFDDLLDKKLKKKYSSLCALCDSSNRCSYSEDQQGSHKEALVCLTEKGDVAYVALQHAKEYFGQIHGYSSRAPADEYKFLCSNGSHQPLTHPCPWVKQPWPVVVVVKNKTQILKPLLPGWLCNRSTPDCRKTWKEAFTLLFAGEPNSYVQYSDSDIMMLDNYLRRAAENEKCEWLKQAVIAQDIEPRLTCVLSNSTWSCLDLIRKRQADIVGIDSDYLFSATKDFNLTTAMYLETSNQQNYEIVALVRNNSNISSIESLKGKKACFPEYNSLAWNAFVAVAKKQSLLPSSCPYLKAISSFFSYVSAPGIKDTNRSRNTNNVTIPENLCSLYPTESNSTKNECEANSNNKYYGDFGAFSCLVDMVSDVAFVNYPNLFMKNEILMKNVDKKLYHILCLNGTLIPMLNPTGVPDTCILSFGIGAEIVTRLSDSKNDKQDAVEMLLKLNDRFGVFMLGFDNVMRMYNKFNNKSGLMFKESTFDLIPAHDQSNHHVGALIELEASVSEKCIEKNTKMNTAVTNFSSSKSLTLLCSVLYVWTIF